MSIVDLFSKRQKRIRGDVPDVYQYEEIPQALRVQIVHIRKDAFGDHQAGYGEGARNACKFIHDALCREYGMFQLQEQANDPFEAVGRFLLRTKDVEKAIDVIELSFRYIDRTVRANTHMNMRVSSFCLIRRLWNSMLVLVNMAWDISTSLAR